HHAVSGLVMLVDADDVKAKLFGIAQLVEIGIVFRSAFFRVIKAVGQHHPGRAVLGGRLQIERPIRHQMKAGELHAPARWRDDTTLSVTRSHCSIWGLCPQAPTIVTRAPATRFSQSAA